LDGNASAKAVSPLDHDRLVHGFGRVAGEGHRLDTDQTPLASGDSSVQARNAGVAGAPSGP
jgi:hypothetical protein